MRDLRLLLASAIVVALLVSGCAEGGGTSTPSGTGGSGTSGATSSEGQTAASGGEALVNELCVQCHAIDRVQAARKDKAGWEETVTRMQSNGLQISDADKAAVVEYLAATYGP